ncbi:amino acid ABC transporter substrate-binding protein [Agrilactobacillus fermenti]|uniref:amino acid ABC transporter substrate-binding protein n=1 Tax=Agrilactobacillus fermenti TaxID=2586909 RepID=UPI001E621CB0|nr:amino acid ABC transporter substrate-binding protein [Agrilactobacillus fermenti]MCD2256489.1 amino acid ABC transporter substrate-binding protein [Agrilactobacillus fermenti]
MKKMRRVGLWFVLLLVLPVLASCGRVNNQVDSWPQLQKRGRLIIGLDDSFVPMGFRAKNGQLRGFDIDLANAVGKKLHMKMDFQTIDWNMKETELKNHTIDLIWNGYTVNPDRAKKVLFSKTYLNNRQILVSLKKNKIEKFVDMKGKYLGAQNGSSGQSDLNGQPKLLKQYIKNQDPILYDNFNEAFIDLNAGRINGLLIDRVYADYYIAHQKDRSLYRKIPGEFSDEHFAVGMRKKDKLLKKHLDKALVELYQDGTIKRISEKWFGQDDTVPIK